MSRGRISVVTLLVVLPVLLFAIFVWLNWSPLRVITAAEGQWLQLRVGGGKMIETRLGELLIATFGFGALMGVLAALASVGGRLGVLRSSNEALQQDRRKLSAANRALEAALPVLRERYDEIIGGLDPHRRLMEQPADDIVAGGVDIRQIAREEAAAEQARRGAGSRS
ncbi:MAG: hypothetical protein IT204_15210 [Fimbriimonadaceae bacterium]|nr:hypothetical protein [Fimbriimonadaceae bacterium]